MGTQLLETIKCLDGKLSNLQWHTARFNQARTEYFGLHTRMNLVNFIKVPCSAKKGLYRCRVTYSQTIDSLEFIPYQLKHRNSLKLIEDKEIDYKYKFADRKSLNELYEKRGDCDDILIVKNGCITDSYTANSVFFDGEKWWTPNTPLLIGTQRTRLISEGKISECKITLNDFTRYKKVGLINAFCDLTNMPVINIQNIVS